MKNIEKNVYILKEKLSNLSKAPDEITIFITSDGSRFFAEKEAETHQKKSNNTKPFLVSHTPDLNETGMLTKKCYLIVTAHQGHTLLAENWCFEKFGSSTAFIQGISACQNWRLSPIEMERLESHIPKYEINLI